MDWTGFVAVVGFFATVITGMVAFSPIGRAIGTRLLKKGALDPSPEIREAVDELADRVEGLQQQVAELAERQDFAERLLAKVKEKGLPAGGAAS